MWLQLVAGAVVVAAVDGGCSWSEWCLCWWCGWVQVVDVACGCRVAAVVVVAVVISQLSDLNSCGSGTPTVEHIHPTPCIHTAKAVANLPAKIASKSGNMRDLTH
jgi:hypothetical protein